MPPPRPVPDLLRTGPFDLATGLDVVTRGQLRGPSYRRLTRGIYQDAGAARGYVEKLHAMRLLVPRDAVLAGLAAAWAQGFHLARAGDPVEFIGAEGRVRPRPGLIFRAEQLGDDEVVMTPFGFATSPARTAFDLARAARLPRLAARGLLARLARDDVPLTRTAPGGPALFGFPDLAQLAGKEPRTVAAELVVAVSRVDAVLGAAKLERSSLAAQVEKHPGVRGIWSARAVAAVADPRAESPPESVLRGRIVLAGLLRPEPQHEIFDPRGTFVARPNLSWPESLLSAEYDGAYHDERPQIRRDRKRDVRGHKVSWRIVHFDASDLRDVPTLIRDIHTILLQRSPT